MRKFTFALMAMLIGLLSAPAFAAKYEVTVTNVMADELLAPVLVSHSRKADGKIFVDGYVTPEAESQILTGDPAMLKESIGKKSLVAHGSDGPPGVLLGPGKSVTFTVRSGRPTRIIAMVAPTKTPDHFVTALVNPKAGLTVYLDRYDIGHDEGRMMTEFVSSAAARVEFKKM